MLAQLRDAGIRLRYHGDFDWPGLQIGNRVVRRYGADSWRFDHDDYLAAASADGRPLRGPFAAARSMQSGTMPCVAPWLGSARSSTKSR